MNLMPRTAPLTLKQALLNKVLQVVSLTIAAGILLFVGQSMNVLGHAGPYEQGSMGVQADAHAKGSPAAVWAKHSDSCWQSQDPALTDDLPTAAIIQWADGHAVYTAKAAIVSSAFDEALASMGYGDHEDKRFKVVALCL